MSVKNAAVFLCLQQNPRVRNSVYRPVYILNTVESMITMREGVMHSKKRLTKLARIEVSGNAQQMEIWPQHAIYDVTS